MKKADKLLKEVLDFRRGEGKYDFNYLCQYDKLTQGRKAWHDLESKIIDHLGLTKTKQKPTM